MQNDYKKTLSKILLICAFMSSGFIQAQYDIGTYFLNKVPQKKYTNPAFFSENRFHIGSPALSSHYYSFGNSGFKINQALILDSDDSLKLDINNLFDKMKNNNYIDLNANIELINFGFKVNKLYFTFFSNEKIGMFMNIPKDFFKIGIKGNANYLGEKIDLSGTFFNFLYYREYGLSTSWNFSPKLSLGGTIKLLYGLMNIHTDHFDAYITTDANTYAISSFADFTVNTSLPDILKYDTLDFDPQKFLLNRDNKGFAIDLGATYQLTPKLLLSASVLDFGSIKWKTNVNSYSTKQAQWSFSGFDFGKILNESDSIQDKEFENLADSVSDIFKPVESSLDYKTPLITRIYIGATYSISKKDFGSLLIRSNLYKNKIYPDFTFAYHRDFSRNFSIVTSYSILNYTYNNIGFGFSTTFRPFQLYLTSDNIMAFFYPENSNKASIRFGINWVIRYKGKKEEPIHTEPPSMMDTN